MCRWRHPSINDTPHTPCRGTSYFYAVVVQLLSSCCSVKHWTTTGQQLNNRRRTSGVKYSLLTDKTVSNKEGYDAGEFRLIVFLRSQKEIIPCHHRAVLGKGIEDIDKHRHARNEQHKGLSKKKRTHHIKKMMCPPATK